jgi:hypothetical protein
MPEINISCNYSRRCNKFNELVLGSYNVKDLKHKIMFRKYLLYRI